MDVNHYGKRKTVQKIFFHLRKKWGKYFFYNGYWYKLNTKYKFYEYKKIPTNLHIHAPIDPGLLENQTFMEKLKKSSERILKNQSKQFTTMFVQKMPVLFRNFMRYNFKVIPPAVLSIVYHS